VVDYFAGKVAFVAGGGGMGTAIAEALVAAGAQVAVADLDADHLEAPNTANRFGLTGDLSDETFVEQAVARTLDCFGGLDYLVNTTGVLWFDRDRSVVDMDMAVWDQVLRINLKSFALTARHAVPAMITRGGGAMVHFSSIDALAGDARPQDAYGAAKAAVIRLSKSLAIQFAGAGIRSNVILPGPALTPMQARWDADQAAADAVADAVPLGRLGSAQDMADACLFLLSDKASYITGTELVVDGGLTAGH